MEKKKRLIELMNLACDEIWAVIESLPAEARAASGSLNEWSAKDTIAHIAYWLTDFGRELRGARAGAAFSSQPDLDRVNNATYARNHERPWAEVTAELESACGEAIAQLEELSEEDLTDINRFQGLEGRPLWRRFVSLDYLHPILHLDELMRNLGDMEGADRLAEISAQMLAPLDDAGEWRGTVMYNLACHYALSGQRMKAIANLDEALRLNPALTGWAKKDADLDSIRGEPACQEILQRAAGS